MTLYESLITEKSSSLVSAEREVRADIAWDFPLPSTGRGIEGEGWCNGTAKSKAATQHFTTPHPGPLPIEGRGRTVHRLLPFFRLRMCGDVVSVPPRIATWSAVLLPHSPYK